MCEHGDTVAVGVKVRADLSHEGVEPMTHIYRSKPTTVEAALVKDDNLARVAEWCRGKPITQAGRGVIVPTINGNATAWVGHYVVKGVSDFYPCDPATFDARWERVDTQDAVHGANNDASPRPLRPE